MLEQQKKLSNSIYLRNIKGFPRGSVVKHPPAKQEMWVKFLGPEDPQEKGMATHSSILDWKIPRTEEPHRVTKSWT